MLTVFGLNFDYEAEVLVGGEACQINGTFFINATTSEETCYKPPYFCSKGIRNTLPCYDVEYSSDCPGGGICTVHRYLSYAIDILSREYSIIDVYLRACVLICKVISTL